jgi:hypothetical protein
MRRAPRSLGIRVASRIRFGHLIGCGRWASRLLGNLGGCPRQAFFRRRFRRLDSGVAAESFAPRRSLDFLVLLGPGTLPLSPLPFTHQLVIAEHHSLHSSQIALLERFPYPLSSIFDRKPTKPDCALCHRLLCKSPRNTHPSPSRSSSSTIPPTFSSTHIFSAPKSPFPSNLLSIPSPHSVRASSLSIPIASACPFRSASLQSPNQSLFRTR